VFLTRLKQGDQSKTGQGDFPQPPPYQIHSLFLIASKVLDARRRGVTTEAYEAIRRKPALAQAGGGAIEGNAADDALKAYQCPPAFSH
jgi:hypothetical protein